MEKDILKQKFISHFIILYSTLEDKRSKVDVKLNI